MNHDAGWVGNWSPGIGDPTPIGWLTVVCYAWAAWAACRVILNQYELLVFLDEPEKRLWQIFVAGLVFLGINKQLDLQSALTEIARMLALYGGWYQDRRVVQIWFIAGIAILALLACLFFLIVARRACAGTKIAILGLVFLCSFIVIRAASFHHVDVFIGETRHGIRVNWVLEIGGLLVVSAGAFLRSKKRHASPVVHNYL